MSGQERKRRDRMEKKKNGNKKLSGQEEKWSVGEGRDEGIGEVEWTKRKGRVGRRGEIKWVEKRGGVKKRGVNGRRRGSEVESR